MGAVPNLKPVWIPESDAEREAIRAQLERMLASPLFRNSKRYPALLRFVVERTLNGFKEPLKERTLGVEVFGRAPDYDTNMDPVVRTSAVEIRKRIAQYYDDLAHAGEIRIDLPAGSYMPEFHFPRLPALGVSEPLEPAVFMAEAASKSVYLRVAGLVVLLCLAAVGAYFLRGTSRRVQPIDAFWAPVIDSQEPVSIYIGGYLNGSEPVSLTELQDAERVAFSDATAMARVTSWLTRQGKSYRLRLQPVSRMEDLKDAPAIFIGGFNNSWTLRLTGTLRFSFERDTVAHISRLKDRDDPANTQWSHTMSAPFNDVTEDYAVISRVTDPSTGRVVVTLSGLAKFGTEAAGEFLTNPDPLNEAMKSLPDGWRSKNLQMVIGTTPVGRRAGPARIIKFHSW